MPVSDKPPQQALSRRAIDYSAALISVGAATLVRIYLTRFIGPTAVPFITYFPAVVFSAWLGGLGPGIMSLILGAALADYLFLPPHYSFAVYNPADLILLGTFLFVGLGIVAIGEAQRRSQSFGHSSRRSLATTIKSIGDAVIATDLNGCVTLINPEAERLTGWKEAVALGTSLTEVFVIVNEYTRLNVESPVAKVMRDGIVVGLANHTILVSRDGTEHPIDDSGAPIRDQSGNVSGVILIFRDITERRRAEQIQRRLAAIVESSEDAIIGKTLDAIITDWNTGAEHLYGYTAQEMIGQPVAVLVPPENTDELPAIMQRLQAGEIIERYETLRVRKDGSRLPVALTISPIHDSVGQIIGASTIARDITERKMADEAIRESAGRIRSILETALDAVVTIDADGRITSWNAQAEIIFGWSREAAIGQLLADTIIPERYREPHRQGMRSFLETGEGPVLNKRIEINALHRSGREIPIELAISPAKIKDTFTFSAFIRDLTERKQMEEQLLQAQKMESVGRLAGGVAHDFNNLLTAILGYSELVEQENGLTEKVRGHLANVRQAGERATNLTRQLLSFARRQMIDPSVVNLNDLILGLDKMLRRLITENIELVTLPENELHSVKVDPGQFEQILMNLVVNARDAMPNGGKITIETRNAILDAEYVRQHGEVTPGEYVMLVVSDTGSGMDEAVKLHIFEPFFTTKEKGRGTGLGLATVYGIVKQAGGHIWLYSEPGEGTTFKIYLPRTTEEPQTVAVSPNKEQPRGSELILLVEDEDSVRALAVSVLRGRGYTVLEAADGEEALQLASGREQDIALLITDVVMPKMSGKELAERLKSRVSGIKVLYVSGYTENTVVHHGVLDEGVEFLTKPFTPTTFASKVRQVLEQ